MLSTNGLKLKTLSLNNFATFPNEEIHFDEHLNIIIGETGSGKSLLFDALNLIFGSRSDKSLVRANSDYAVIEALFELTEPEIKNYFKELGYPCEDDEVLIKKIINQNGKSKSFLNYQQCKAQTLQQFSRKFIDLIGQFENQKLLNSSYQLQIIDLYCKNEPDLDLYKNSFQTLKSLREMKESLLNKKSSFDQRMDYISFQLNQINELDPSKNDEDKLIALKKRYMNFEEHSKMLNSSIDLINESDNSILNMFSKFQKIIESSPELFTSITPSELQTTSQLLNDLSYKVSSINLEQSEDDYSLDEVLTRLDTYQKLKRKFGESIESVIEARDEFIKEKNSIENFESEISSIDQKIEKVSNDLSKVAKKLHTKRVKSSVKVEKLITECLQELNMVGATFYVKIKKLEELNAKGYSHLEFHIETNQGEGVYPLSQIVSGGELSRVLLAIRRHITSRELISIFLFDEIDSGIGGETALLIGKLLQKISQTSQVIAISHLPQIAFQASQLIEVKKKSLKQAGKTRTISEAIAFNKNGMIKEKARMMTPIN